MTNKFAIKPGNEGLYQVNRGRALHWPTDDGKPRVWATTGRYVDLRSPFLIEVVMRTGQLHKLTRVEEVPAGGVMVGIADIPPSIRDRMRAYEEGGGVKVTITPTAEETRSVDLSQLPSAAPEAEAEAEKPRKRTRRKAKLADPEEASDE